MKPRAGLVLFFFSRTPALLLMVLTCGTISALGGSIVTINTDKVMELNGRKVFPILLSPGPPTGGRTPDGVDALEELAQAGALMVRLPQTTAWNSTAISNQHALLDWAADHGMYCMVNLSELSAFGAGDTNTEARLRSLINKFKNHPALGVWKNKDEAWWSRTSVADLRRGYEVIRQEDSKHPVEQTLAPRGKVAQLQPYNAAADILALDIYPVSLPPGIHSLLPNKEISMVGDWTQFLAQVANGERTFWMIEQIGWSGATPPKRPLVFPTFRQSRYMAYQAIINGARGLMFYGGNIAATLNAQDAPLGWNWTFWKEVLKPVVQEIGDHSMLASVLVTTNSGLPITMSGTVAPDAEFCVRETPPYIYILVSKREGATRNITFGGLPLGATGEVLYEEPRTVTARGGQFTDRFAPFDVHVYRFAQSNVSPAILSPSQTSTDGISLELQDKTNTLDNCAQRWGEFMVNHWMTMELTEQIDRALFYGGDRQTALRIQRDALQQGCIDLDKKLQHAREQYQVLYRKPDTHLLSSLNGILDEVALGEAENERTAERLLQTLGEQLSGKQFKATVVSKKQLEPAWKLDTLLGKNYRPTRILFGSTAPPGDNRVLPLRFDFGKGVFGFYVPVESPGVLAIASNVLNQTSPRYAWMKAHRIGYHYWAGVYNNQNTYVAPWFLQRHRDDADAWMKLADGKVLWPSGGDWGQVNIWNPLVQDYIRDYCQAQAHALQQDPFLLGYDYTAEPHPWGSQPPQPPHPQYSGYNESAVRSFRDYLCQKFSRIAALNQAWRTSYESFDMIQPPPDPYVSPPSRATPLSYEFERFRCESHTRFWRSAYEAYRKLDKRRPIIANAGMYMSGWPVEALDSWGLEKAGVADWVDMHMNNFWPNLAEQIYLYSLCRLTGKIPVQFEYIWTFPRPQPFDDTNESDFRATCRGSVWRNLVWGKKALVFFDVAYDWPAYHNAFLDRDLGFAILRPSICVVPALKRKALQFQDLLLNTEVATPPIIVLQPSASVWNSPPIHPNHGFSYHTSVAGHEVHPLLFPKNYPFLYVPEEAVLEDNYPLQQHAVVILPQAPYLPGLMTDRLLDWIRRGGTLISFGLPGLWNPYGQEDLRLLTTIFGKSEVTDKQPGQWKWSWRLFSSSHRLELLRDQKENGLAAQAPYGKGNVLVSTATYDTPELRKLFYQTLDKAIGRRPAACATDAFELVLREDTHHRRYLFVLNPRTRELGQDEVIIDGQYPSCVDLGVGSGVPLPVRVTKNATAFTLRLQPGEATVIALMPK